MTEKIVHCRECIFFEEAHILCPDGTRKSYSDFGPGAMDQFGVGVTSGYGINVGSKCTKESYFRDGEFVDRSFFRGKDDFCSRGVKYVRMDFCRR